MCGRYSLTTPTEAMQQVFRFAERPNLAPRYNIAPTQEVAAVRLGDDGARHFVSLRWGLIPFWAKDAGIGSRMINARAEGLADKPAFRAAFKRRRCLVLADGFYEWQKRGKADKQPFRVTLAHGGPFGFAGLWESWTNKQDGSRVESCTIVTTTANPLVASIHDRMPVILDPADVDTWLDAEGDAAAALALLAPYPAELMAATPVSTRVNSVKNDDPAVIEPLEAESEVVQGRLPLD